MKSPRSLVKRLLLAAGLALGILTPAALGGPGVAAGPQSTLSPLQIQPFGTKATVTFTSSEPVIISYDLKAVTATGQPASQPPRRPLDSVRAPLAGESVATTSDSTPPSLAAFTTQHQIPLTGLRSNTTYDVFVTATTQLGLPLTAQARFTTLKQRVRVTLREITITEDGDAWWMNGEPWWLVNLEWAGGSVFGCYPNTDVGNGEICQYGSFGEGRFFPRTVAGQWIAWTFAEENFDTMPAEFRLRVTAKEVDVIPGVANVVGWLTDCITAGECGHGFSGVVPLPPWQAPQDVEWASTPVRVRANDDGTGFASTLHFTFELFHDNLSYPSARNAPHSTW